MEIVCREKLLVLSFTELKMLLCLIPHINEQNEYFLNAMVKQSIGEQSGLMEQTIRATNSKLVKNEVVVRIKNGWYRLSPEVMKKA